MIPSHLPLGVVVNNSSLFFVFQNNLFELQNVNNIWRPLINRGHPSGHNLKDHNYISNVNDESLFIVAENKQLLEFNIPTAKWINHGSPSQTIICTSPCGGAMFNNSLFVACSDKNLYRRHRTSNNTWSWENMGKPSRLFFGREGFSESAFPIAMHDGRLFIIDKSGNLRELRQDSNNIWHWSNHKKPPSLLLSRVSLRHILGAVIGAIIGAIIGALIGGLPGAIIGGITGAAIGYTTGHYINGGKTRIVYLGAPMMPSRKIFTVCQDGYLNERYINGNSWVWSRHDKTPNASSPITMNDGKLFLSLLTRIDKSSLQQRYYSNGNWISYNHGNLINGTMPHLVKSGPSEAIQIPDRVFVLTNLKQAVNDSPFFISSIFWDGSGWSWENHVRLP
nr:YMGG-like glycine zipper-containing protein [uncultured Psychroserpens sp.]